MTVTFEEALKTKDVWKSPEDLISPNVKKLPTIAQKFIRKFKNWPIDVYNCKVNYYDRWGNRQSFILENGKYHEDDEEV